MRGSALCKIIKRAAETRRLCSYLSILSSISNLGLTPFLGASFTECLQDDTGNRLVEADVRPHLHKGSRSHSAAPAFSSEEDGDTLGRPRNSTPRRVAGFLVSFSTYISHNWRCKKTVLLCENE